MQGASLFMRESECNAHHLIYGNENSLPSISKLGSFKNAWILFGSCFCENCMPASLLLGGHWHIHSILTRYKHSNNCDQYYRYSNIVARSYIWFQDRGQLIRNLFPPIK